MKSLNSTLVAGVCIAALMTAGVATAQQAKPQGGAQQQQTQQQGGGQKAGAKHTKGQKLSNWKKSPKVDYKKHNLKAPAKGYEWHEDNGEYVLVAVATGVIASIISK